MKKISLSVIVMGLMSTSAMAVYVEGTVVGVQTSPNGSALAIKRKSDGVVYNRFINLSDDNLKQFLAIALTALSTQDKVLGTGPAANWESIKVKKY